MRYIGDENGGEGIRNSERVGESEGAGKREAVGDGGDRRDHSAACAPDATSSSRQR